MKKILVPTDFSEIADKARDYAIQLAQVMGAEITLLNTFHIPYSASDAGTLVNLDKIALEESEKAMKQQLEYVNLNYKNIKFSTICKTGLLVDTIKNILANHEFDLIVMGTSGTSGFIENSFGSNTSALIGSVDTPIIAVPKDVHLKFPERIVVANDLMESGEEKLFSVLKEIAFETNSSIDFLFIVKEDGQEDTKIERLKSANFDNNFDSSYHPFHFRDNDNVDEGILDYIENHKFDLLVVVSHQRGFWEGLFHKSISKSLVKHAKLPILVLPD